MNSKVFALVFVSLLLPGLADATLTSENFVVQGSSVATDGNTLNATSANYQSTQEPGDLYRLPAQSISTPSGAQTGTKVPYENSILGKNDVITICHAEGGQKYVAITSVRLSTTVEKPNGGIELGGHASHSEDVIPPFRYDIGSGVQQYQGNNWNQETQKLFANNCTSFLEATVPPNDVPAPAASLSGSDTHTDPPFKFLESLIPKIFKKESISPFASDTPVSLAPATKTYRVLVAVSTFFGLFSGISLALVQLAQAPFSVLTVGRVFSQGWNNLLALLTFKKRRHPWGTVYDSATKAPVDPAYVEIFDLSGTKAAEAITDLDGRYGFVVPDGTYTLQVRKTNYSFPARISNLTGQDVIYNNLYFGGPFSTSGAVAHDVPMDPLHFDWNQHEKLRTKQTRFFHTLDPLIMRFLDLVFFGGVVFMLWQYLHTPNIYTTVLLACYGILLISRFMSKKPLLYGSVTSEGSSLAYALVRVMIGEQVLLTKITDAYGRYVAIVPSETYTVRVEKRISEGQYQKIFESKIKAKHGVINSRIKV